MIADHRIVQLYRFSIFPSRCRAFWKCEKFNISTVKENNWMGYMKVMLIKVEIYSLSSTFWSWQICTFIGPNHRRCSLDGSSSSIWILLLSIIILVEPIKEIEITSWKARACGTFTRVGEVSDIERVSAANEWDFWYFTNECEDPVQSAFHAVICLFYTYWDSAILKNIS